jgi:hypothetical protein
MKPYSHSLRARPFNYSLIHTVGRKALIFQVSILPLAALVIPAITSAGPEDLAKERNCFSCHKKRPSE